MMPTLSSGEQLSAIIFESSYKKVFGERFNFSEWRKVLRKVNLGGILHLSSLIL
jgi:hypothetical protein